MGKLPDGKPDPGAARPRMRSVTTPNGGTIPVWLASVAPYVDTPNSPGIHGFTAEGNETMTIATPHDAANAVEFHDGIAHAWSAGYRRRSFDERLRAFTAIMDREVRPGQRWLDLGCGSGVLTAHLARRCANVVGIDASEPMLREAHRELAQAKVAVTLRCCDARHMHWSEPEAFDGILCSSVVEYFDDPSPLLHESVRVMRPGGVMVVSVPMRRSVTRGVQKILRRTARAVGMDRFRYLAHSRFEVGNLDLPGWLGAHGLQITSAVGFDPVVPSSLHRLAEPALMICTAAKVA